MKGQNVVTKFELTGEKNYAPQVIRVEQVTTVDGLDRLRAIHWSGYQALVSLDVAVGDVMLIFPPESQLSLKLASENNLLRDTQLNADPTQKGYLENNRRVRAIRFRGVSSNALALPISCLKAFTKDVPNVGDVFDTVGGVQISQKYYIKQKTTQTTQKVKKLWRRVDKAMLPEHYDTGQFWREGFKFRDDDYVVVTQKIHGSSWRGSRTIVRRKLNFFEKALRFLGVNIAETELDVVGGSRRVIKDVNNPLQQHYYGEDNDIYTDAALTYGDRIPAHVVVYGELIGWLDDGRPLQSGYTYNVKRGERELYVYRVAVIAPDGGLYDLSWAGVEEFCRERGFKTVPVLWKGLFKDFDPEVWSDRRFYDEGFTQAIPLSDPDTVDEGVVVRREGIIPFALKIKGNKFYEYETALLDKATEDEVILD